MKVPAFPGLFSSAGAVISERPISYTGKPVSQTSSPQPAARKSPKVHDLVSPARARSGVQQLQRETFRTSRLLDFFSIKELVAQTGHDVSDWPLVILKELIDNALDAAEEAHIAPVITVTVNERGIRVTDNGPGIPADIIKGVLDYTVRVSSREAYVSPTRGAQGNALKTIVGMPFALDPRIGIVLEIEANGVRHIISVTVDHIRQEPVIEHRQEPSERKNGTSVLVRWPVSPKGQTCARPRAVLYKSRMDSLG